MQWPEHQDSFAKDPESSNKPAKLGDPGDGYCSWKYRTKTSGTSEWGKRKWLSHCFASGGRDMASLDISASLCALWAILGVGVM